MIFSSSLPEIKSLLKNIRMSGPTKRHLMLLLAGFLDHPGRMSAGMSAAAIASLSVHRANVGRYLGGRGQGLVRIRHRVNQRLLGAARQDGAYTLILDTTQVSHQGTKTENTFSTGNRQRRPAAGRRYHKRKVAPRRCHAFVIGLLITPAGVRVPFLRSYYTHDYCLAKAIPHRTQAELGAELIQEVPLPPGAKLMVLGDTAFEAASVQAACQQREATWITPCNPERVLAGPRPRPKVASLISQLRGDQLEPVKLSPDDAALSAQRRVAACRRGRKIKTKTFYAYSESRCIHSVGQVQIVFSCKEKPENDQPIAHEAVKVLLTNDLTLSCAQIVAWYAVRWQIELFFKELKSVLGMHHYRFRSFARVQMWLEACLIAFMYLEWVRLRRLRRRQLSEDERRWWQWQRSYGLACAVRTRIDQEDLATIYRQTNSRRALAKLRRTLENSLPLEYRHAA